MDNNSTNGRAQYLFRDVLQVLYRNREFDITSTIPEVESNLVNFCQRGKNANRNITIVWIYLHACNYLG